MYFILGIIPPITHYARVERIEPYGDEGKYRLVFVFLSARLGRPVGVAVDRVGALLVADDVGNIVWRVTPAMTK